MSFGYAEAVTPSVRTRKRSAMDMDDRRQFGAGFVVLGQEVVAVNLEAIAGLVAEWPLVDQLAIQPAPTVD